MPDRHAAAFLEPLDVGAVEAPLEIAGVVAGHAGDGIDQIAVADAVDLDGDRFGVDADHRDAALPGARQYIGRGREPHRGLAVAHIDDEVRRFRQRLVHHRRQPGAQRHGIAVAVLKAFDAELLVGRRDGRLVGAAEHDERRKIGARRQILGKLEAGARRGGVGVNRIIEHAETVLVAQPLVLAAHIGGLANVERKPQRVERRPPQLPLAHDVAEKREAVGLLVAVGGALISDVGRGRGALEQASRVPGR